ncbi:Hypothetical protein HVR_LOCUS847 [uncultured virus]|nr:Hypothetical protein HVR_LOCUS847 [uncultured virus]
MNLARQLFSLIPPSLTKVAVSTSSGAGVGGITGGVIGTPIISVLGEMTDSANRADNPGTFGLFILTTISMVYFVGGGVFVGGITGFTASAGPIIIRKLLRR